MSQENNIVGGCGCLENNCCVVKASCVEEITPIDSNRMNIDDVNKSIESAHDVLRNMLACCFEDFCTDYNDDKDKFSSAQRNIVRKFVAWLSYAEFLCFYDEKETKDSGRSSNTTLIQAKLERKLEKTNEKIKFYKTPLLAIIREFYPDCLPSLPTEKKCGCAVDCGNTNCKNSYSNELPMFDVVVKSRGKNGYRGY